MTRKEALEQEQQSEWERDHEILKAYADGQESMKPCKDAISKQAAIRLAEQGQVQGFEWQLKKLVELPPVSVVEKIGHWIWRDDDFNDWLVCSECEYGADGEVNLGEDTPFCPMCGAKMVEKQESEKYRITEIDFIQPKKIIGKLINTDVFNKMKDEFISRYPKNYAGDLQLDGTCCVFSLNDILQIIDKYKAESEEES